MAVKSTEAQAYEKPTIADYGDLRELTEAGTTGNTFDATYTRDHTITFIFSNHGPR